MKDRGPESGVTDEVAFEPARVSRGKRSRFDPGVVAVIAAIVLVGAAIFRPWGAIGHGPVVPPESLPPASEPARAQLSPESPPASPGPTIDLARSATERVIVNPAGHAETWGLAIGAGTRSQNDLATVANLESVISIALDGSWSVWTQVEPKPSSMPAPGTDPELTGVSVTDLCRGLPDLPSGAQVVAVTAPGLPRDYLQVRGWQVVGWHDEPRDIELLPSSRTLASSNAGPINELAQATGGPWPDGRYDFLVGGPTEISLSVCLGRP